MMSKTRCLRVAYLTEMHIQPERGAFEGTSECFRQVYALTDRPDLIINGGDLIMDASAEDWTRANLQFDLWDQLIHRLGTGYRICSYPTLRKIWFPIFFK